MSSPSMEKTSVEPLAAPIATPPTVREPGVVDVEYGWQGNNLVKMLENGEE